MATSPNTSRKVYVPLRLPPALLHFVDTQARSRYLTRNAYIQGLVAAAAAAQPNTPTVG
jgi:hypothetical protein